MSLNPNTMSSATMHLEQEVMETDTPRSTRTTTPSRVSYVSWPACRSRPDSPSSLQYPGGLEAPGVSDDIIPTVLFSIGRHVCGRPVSCGWRAADLPALRHLSSGVIPHL